MDPEHFVERPQLNNLALINAVRIIRFDKQKSGRSMCDNYK